MTTKEKLNVFFDEVGMTKTAFCKKICISTSSLRDWQTGRLRFSDATLGRIEDFLAKYDSVLLKSEQNQSNGR